MIFRALILTYRIRLFPISLWSRFFFFPFSISFNTNKSWLKSHLIPSFLAFVVSFFLLSQHCQSISFHEHFYGTWYDYLLQSIFCIGWIDGYRSHTIVCTFLFSILTQIYSHFTWMISSEHNVENLSPFNVYSKSSSIHRNSKILKSRSFSLFFIFFLFKNSLTNLHNDNNNIV